MSSTKPVDTNTNDRSDWNLAWAAVSRLAAARGATLYQSAEQRQDDPIPGTIDGPSNAAAANSPALFAPIAPDQLERDIAEIAKVAAVITSDQSAPIAPDPLAYAIAEIESAATALRLQEPSLDVRRPAPELIGEPRAARSVWILITSIWISAALVVSGSVGALVLLFG